MDPEWVVVACRDNIHEDNRVDMVGLVVSQRGKRQQVGMEPARYGVAVRRARRVSLENQKHARDKLALYIGCRDSLHGEKSPGLSVEVPPPCTDYQSYALLRGFRQLSFVGINIVICLMVFLA
ncbi:hypothetical protein [Ktedonospora formicarum]|uniref:hypothetical protein n=1 Tax=Ktedonospora formicarum TaxID=2778364 RepID=UPI001C68962E|nr:hypothetical protein [Ktedonospora formicarum]